ncbi:hypothetical protein [Clostridium tagluense]|uniref:hypothetical protein n=1 Tax=Clostridium tagluense TaxID=360422 RepID=UPI001CF3ED59|nr:hypothetical protein [Clostridium tagluense]MCB2297063.1 hypothetical protein [Clostridium tagluense]
MKSNMTNENKLYKVLKVKMKDFETEINPVIVDGIEVINKKTKKVKTKIVTTNIIKIITKDVEYTKKDEVKTFETTVINKKNVRQYHTLIKENDVIRIVRALDLGNNNKLNNNYIFIKDIISVDVKVNTYKNETKDTITLVYQLQDKDENIKITDKGEKLEMNVIYKRLMASSGNVRSKKVIFIREELWENANKILLCGLPVNMEYPQLSKFNAYYALANTDSAPVTSPKIVVIDDYEKDIIETFDVVRPKLDEEDKKIKDEYTCKPEEKYVETIKPFDGAGICDISIAKIWATELGLYKEEIIKDEKGNQSTKVTGYVPSYFQFRAILGIKGNVYVMDIKKYATEYRRRNTTDKGAKQAIIKDVFDNDIEILNSKGELLRNVILTKSQFKFTNKWKETYKKDGFKKWEDEFDAEYVIDKEKNLTYKRTFNIAKYAVDFKNIKREVMLSYQPLQTLHLDEQIKTICVSTIERIKTISTDVDEFLKYRGVVQEFEEQQNKKSDTLIPQYYKALEKNKILWNDKYIQAKVKEDIKGFKERSYKACIIANGNYQVAMPDIVGLIEYAFGEEVVGCLKGNEVYSRYWLNYSIKNEEGKWEMKPVNKIDIIRFPHIAMEHRVVNVVQPGFKKEYDWLEYIGEGIVTSMYDSNALAANSMDFDGDKIMTISTKEIIDQVEKEKVNTITFADYKDDIPKEENATPIESIRINDIDKIIETDCMGMSNDIGSVVNQISKLWSIIPKNAEEKKAIQEMIKIMSIIGSLTIDFVKTGIKSPIPPSIIEFLKDNEIKKPDFMKWKYTKIAKDERAVNRNKKLLKKKEVELFGQTECTVNKISWYMQEQVKDIELKVDTKGDFTYEEFIKEAVNIRADGYIKTLETMIELKKEEDKIGYFQNKDNDNYLDSDDNAEQYTIFYQYAKNKLMEIVANKNYKLDKEKMIDYLIYIVITEKEFKKYDNMNLIWNTWGKELTRRLNDEKLIIGDLDEDKIIERTKKLIERTKKLKVKADKKKETKEKIYINIFNPKAKEEDKKEIKILDTEINAIKKMGEDKNKRLAMTMLVLDKFCKVYKKDFNIANNKNSIKMYNIYQLADINHKNIHDHLRELINNKIIEFEEKDKGKVLSCKVNIDSTGEPVKTIKDVNEIKKLFKLIA